MAMETTPNRMKVTDALPHQLRRGMQAWAAMWQQQFQDLTTPQYAVLALLDGHGSLDQSALGALAAMDRSTLSTLLDRLESQKLVTKAIESTNRRRRIVTLTDAGRVRLNEATPKMAQLIEDLEQLFGPDDMRRLVLLLRRLGDVPSLRLDS
ncbi:MarR family transcriptional regulator [Nocardia sp. NEAU-G5]|uniref:MarR family transcriptional regulator n=1 Tax=Nocardia albiluteola TaxID=2842303 RepID=A0ABS6AYL8_9NOCA|nr:MarR family transcriptional regulator [Nocardia albiluteola]MBU3062306.1 MarR family transcriptional regulator [Nocardia albiluteola]